MLAIINRLASKNIVQSLPYHLIRAYSMTFRLKVENELMWLDHYAKQDGIVLLCTYHQQFFSAIRYFKRYRFCKPGIMISKSRDGGLISSVAERTGWHPVRGSSSKGGSEGLKMMIEHLIKNRLAAHIVDGPLGPAGKVKSGAIRLAQAASAAIVPFYVHADRAWYFRSWDRFLLPKPFAKVVLKFGDIITYKTANSRDEFELQRQSLEKAMFREHAMLKGSFN